MLTWPCDRRIEQAADTDSARQPSIDSGLDEAWREEGERDRHSARRHPTGPSRRRDQAAETRRLVDRFEWHYTPKHAVGSI
jgi:hypothetical protein